MEDLFCMLDSTFDPAWMMAALQQAHEAELKDEVPVGAVVIHQNKIIAKGQNTRETEQNPIGHAEINAIAAASKTLNSWRLIDCTLVVTLEPCPMCLAACQQARISKVIYGASDPKGGALCLGYHLHQDLKTNHQFSVEYFESSECSKILKYFFSKVRKRNQS
jgi:tRNA(adenine34) deaminase